jgi:hypothetical protein
MDWETFKQTPHMVLGAAVVIAALVIGGVMLKISHDNSCKPVPVQHARGVFGDNGTYETLEKPPGC